MVNRIIAYTGLMATSLGLFLPFRMEQLYGGSGRSGFAIISSQPDLPWAPLGPFFLALIISGALLTVFGKPTLALTVSIIMLVGVLLPLSEAVVWLEPEVIGTGGALMLTGAVTFSIASTRVFRTRQSG